MLLPQYKTSGKKEFKQAELPYWKQRKNYVAEISPTAVTNTRLFGGRDKSIKLFTFTSSSDWVNFPSSLQLHRDFIFFVKPHPV